MARFGGKSSCRTKSKLPCTYDCKLCYHGNCNADAWWHYFWQTLSSFYLTAGIMDILLVKHVFDWRVLLGWVVAIFFFFYSCLVSRLGGLVWFKKMLSFTDHQKMTGPIEPASRSHPLYHAFFPIASLPNEKCRRRRWRRKKRQQPHECKRELTATTRGPIPNSSPHRWNSVGQHRHPLAIGCCGKTRFGAPIP